MIPRAPANGKAGTCPALATALAYVRAGLSVIPVRADGSKRPALPAWERFQRQLPDEAEIRRWWQDGSKGIAVLGGAVSGNLECIDFDRGELFPAWRELVEAQAPGLAARLCVVRTPRQAAGYHVRYRCRAVTIPGNTKLAQEPGTDPRTGKPTLLTRIETRGEGGYALAPGSPPACHETGRTYEHVAGPPLTQLPDLTAAEREILIAAARSFDLAGAAKARRPGAGGGAEAGLRPGDDYDRRGPDWSEILGPHGWSFVGTRGDGARLWRRPGKDGPGISATTGYCKGPDGADLLAVFSSNAHPFEGPTGTRPCTCYGKFAAFAQLNHGGDFQAAARELARRGYGERRRPASPPSAGGPRNGAAAAPSGTAAQGLEAGPPHRTDRGNGVRLARQHGHELRYCFPWRKWLVWDGRRWRVDDTDEPKRRAKLVVVALFHDAVERIKEIERELRESAGGGDEGQTGA